MQEQFKSKEPQREDNSVDNKSARFKFVKKQFNKNSSSDNPDDDN